MDKIRFAASLMAAGVLASSCMIRIDREKFLKDIAEIHIVRPSGVAASRDTTLTGFNSISYGGRIKVILIQDDMDGNNVNITASDNVLPHVNVYVEDRTLHISSRVMRKPGVYMETDDDVTVTVHAPAVSSVHLSGAGEFSCSRLDIPGRLLSIDISGSGEMELGSVRAGNFSAAVTGSGELDVDSAEAGDMSVAVSGSGSVEIGKMEAENVSASVAGSGSVEFGGTAASAVFSVAGSGEIDAEKLKCGTVSTHVGGSGSIKYMDNEGKVHDTDR